MTSGRVFMGTGDEGMKTYQQNGAQTGAPNKGVPDMGPIEPERGRPGKVGAIKWAFFIIIIIYVLLAQFHAPILTRIGKYLIVEHPPQKSDLIVCLAGRNIERGLAASDAYRKGLASGIYLSIEEEPDGLDILRRKGVFYPRSIDLLVTLLTDLGVPREKIQISAGPVKSTIEEAKVIRTLVKKKDYRSLILVTSPTHSRRTWLTFKRIFKDDNVRI
ncbi:MAG: YdcF family protein, partial [Deltaproteobacteria bacterium]|nr:YdcF family protein [Deltaproteobacteria bacterium]